MNDIVSWQSGGLGTPELLVIAVLFPAVWSYAAAATGRSRWAEASAPSRKDWKRRRRDAQRKLKRKHGSA